LEQALDSSMDWVSIFKVAQHNGISEKLFSWRALKSKALELGYQTHKRIGSVRFKYQNLYHIHAFMALYPDLKYDFDRSLRD
jgi:hypothetical protein